MRNSPVEILAIGHDEVTGEMLFSMTVKTEALAKWLQSPCSVTPTVLTNYLSEELLVESIRLFDIGQNADIGDEVSIYKDGSLCCTGLVQFVTDEFVRVGTIEYPLDEYSVRYADGKIHELFGELHQDLLLDLSH